MYPDRIQGGDGDMVIEQEVLTCLCTLTPPHLHSTMHFALAEPRVVTGV